MCGVFNPDIETLPAWEAFDRVLAENVYSRVNVPNKTTSSLDAIAVRFDDFACGIPDTSAWKRSELVPVELRYPYTLRDI